MPWKERYTISDERTILDREIRWPEGKRCCLSITVDLSVARGPEGITAADLGTPEAAFGFGQGLEALRGVLKRRRLQATVAVPAVIAHTHPEVVRSLAEEGHEIAAHGLRHEDVSGLAREEERTRIAQATELLSKATGRRPEGWFSLARQSDPFSGGTISPHTMELLLEAGYLYMGNSPADDAPHWWVSDFARRRAILALPYYYHFDDQFFLLFPRQGTGLEHPDSLARNWRAEFDAQYKRGRHFHMTLHPQHIGWCNRLQLLEEFLDYAAAHPDLWNPTGAECARHWTTTYPQAEWLRLEPSIWKDYPGSLS